MTDRIAQKLTTLPLALRQEGFEPVPYRHLYYAAIDGVFPAQQIGAVWHWCPDDLTAIARVLKLKRARREAVAA